MKKRRKKKKSNIINEVSFFKVFACICVRVYKYIRVYFTKERETVQSERFVAFITHRHKSAQYFRLSCTLGLVAAETKAIYIEKLLNTRMPTIYTPRI